MTKITRVSKDCLALIEEFECQGNFRNCLRAYQSFSGKWSIGMGTTRYPDGRAVMPGDCINDQQVFEYITYDLAAVESAVTRLVIPEIEQHQFDALVSFTYKTGELAFGNSNLLSTVNANPMNPNIEKQFMRWVYSRGKAIPELIRRRQAEYWLYFHGELKFHFPRAGYPVN